MGYVWIVRIYLIIAAFTPFIKSLGEKIDNTLKFLCFLGSSCLFLLILWVIGNSIKITILKTLFWDFLYSGLVYAIIAILGYLIIKDIKMFKCALISSLVTICICSIYSGALTGRYFIPEEFKFPPHLYYCSYGIAVTLILYRLVPNSRNRIISWVSTNSFSIYLWHIIMLRVYGIATKIHSLSFASENWLLEYIFVTVGTIIVVVFWNKVKIRILGKINYYMAVR